MIWRLLAGASLAAATFAAPALAQDYPAKPVTLIVGYPAGGPVDSLARALAQRLSDELKQPFVIDNKPGANEIVATQFMAKSKPDGYTLFVSTEAPLTQNQFLYKKLGYVPETDLAPVTHLVNVPMVLTVSPRFPANTVKEFIAAAKSRSDKELINYASAGLGGVTHLPMAMFGKNEGFRWNHVPYRGAAPILPDLMSGQVDATMLAVSFLGPHINEKKVKALAVSAEQRARMLPHVPTFKELGIKEIKASFIIAMTGPKGLPAPIAEKLAAASRKIVHEKEFREKNIDSFAYTPIGSSLSEFASYLAADRVLQEERVKTSGASLDY